MPQFNLFWVIKLILAHTTEVQKVIELLSELAKTIAEIFAGDGVVSITAGSLECSAPVRDIVEHILANQVVAEGAEPNGLFGGGGLIELFKLFAAHPELIKVIVDLLIQFGVIKSAG